MDEVRTPINRLLSVLILDLRRAQISERGVETASVVDLVDESRKIGRDVLESLVGHQIYWFTFRVFMKLSALASS